MNKYQKALNNLKTMGDKDLYNERNTEWCNILQKLVDKETPKKVIKFISGITNSEEAYSFYICPKCKMLLSNDIYCSKCGQHLDWSDK